RLEAIEVRHLHVHHDDARPQRLRHLDRVAAVRRLADDLEPGIRGEQRDEQLARGRGVFGDQDADLHSSWPTISSSLLWSKEFFTRYASAPTSSPRALSASLASAVSRITGKSRNRFDDRIASVSANPSIRGISMSDTTRSAPDRWSSCHASAPSTAV